MTAKQEDLNSALSPCGSGSHVIYAWALNAPELILPEGVGFRVGGPDSDIDWLVLQVHYASINRIPEEGWLKFYEKFNKSFLIKKMHIPAIYFLNRRKFFCVCDTWVSGFNNFVDTSEFCTTRLKSQ